MKTMLCLFLLTIQNFVLAGDLIKTPNTNDDCVVDLSMVPLDDYRLIKSCIKSHNEERLASFLKEKTVSIPQSLVILAKAEKKSVYKKESFRSFHTGGSFGVCIGAAGFTVAAMMYRPDLAIAPLLLTSLYAVKTAKNVVRNGFYKSYSTAAENIADLVKAHAHSDTQK